MRMKSYSEWKALRSQKKRERNRKRAEYRAREIFQIIEYRGEFWYTCNSVLLCPCSFITDEPVITFVERLRSIYVEREMNK